MLFKVILWRGWHTKNHLASFPYLQNIYSATQVNPTLAPQTLENLKQSLTSLSNLPLKQTLTQPPHRPLSLLTNLSSPPPISGLDQVSFYLGLDLTSVYPAPKTKWAQSTHLPDHDER